MTRGSIAAEEAALQAHVSIGAAVFALTLLRLCLRAVRPASSPERAPSGPGTRGAALGHAALSHAALYAGLIGAPVSGYVALAAAGFEVWAFDLASLPALPFDPVTAATALSAHKALAAGLGALIAGHAVVGIWRLRRGPGDG